MRLDQRLQLPGVIVYNRCGARLLGSRAKLPESVVKFPEDSWHVIGPSRVIEVTGPTNKHTALRRPLGLGTQC
jgi:hypothetical protein